MRSEVNCAYLEEIDPRYGLSSMQRLKRGLYQKQDAPFPQHVLQSGTFHDRASRRPASHQDLREQHVSWRVQNF